MITKTDIFESAPFPSCHAATLVETGRGILAAWFGGSREGAADVCVYTARLEGGRWSPPRLVADGSPYPCWNPVLFRPRGGPVMLSYKVGPNPRDWWGMVKTSEDEGESWSAARRLPDGLLGPIKNKPVQLPSGRIIAPSSREGFLDPNNDGGALDDTVSPRAKVPASWGVYFEISDDGAESWRATPMVQADAGIAAIQPSILVHSPTTLQAIGRTRNSWRLFETWSHDGGETWSRLALMSLPNCNSGTDAVTLRVEDSPLAGGCDEHGRGARGTDMSSNTGASPVVGGGIEHGRGARATARHVLVYNHSNIEKVRYPLNLALSPDGKMWFAGIEIESEPPGQYSYPAIIQASDGLVHVAYTWKRRRIRHAVIDARRIEPRPIETFVCPPPGSPTHRVDASQ